MQTNEPNGPEPTPTPEPAFSVEEEILRALRKIVRAIDLRSRDLVDKHGVTGPQLATLRELARGGRSASDLAAAVHLSPATMTGILQRLQARGLVSKNPDLRDRRVIQVALTEQGRAELSQVASPLQDTFRRDIERLARWEQYAILSTLLRIAAMMGASDLDAAPLLVVGPIDETAENPALLRDTTDGAP